ncbi:hypothetical protein AR1Y2_0238 [Anaerostipes rhamnosivorans]|uniref:Uncharacterized protein n=1 Tax=Anaerostipes rhamnosivorans TaxID=1229621 RepID=A0A4P8I890_9FIRM|nr:hypothetical protein AR1Y2_0238 [Anaerostipes rhamnosivorans]
MHPKVHETCRHNDKKAPTRFVSKAFLKGFSYLSGSVSIV